MLKFEAQFWSTFQTLENEFELLSGRFVDSELPFKISPRIQAKKKKTPQKKTTTRNPNASFCRKERFREKRKKTSIFFSPLVCWPFCCQRPLNTIAKNTIKQGVCCFSCCVFLVGVPQTRRNNKTTKQQNDKQQQQQR